MQHGPRLHSSHGMSLSERNKEPSNSVEHFPQQTNTKIMETQKNIIKISERTLVLPSRTPFLHDHALPLSHLDTDPNLQLTFRYLRAYVSSAAPTTTSISGDPFNVISSALSEALVHYYPLAGTLRRREDRRLESWCSAGKGVPLIRASADVTLDSVNYLDGQDFGFTERLVPDPGPEEGLEHPCMLQVTVFRCGGFTLGAAMHHAICDGMGGGLFFNAVAEMARGSTRISVVPVWDREKLLGPRDPPRVESPMIKEFLSLEKGWLPYQEDIGRVVRECFHVNDDCLDGFKRYLFEQSALNFTTFEALGAYIWRSKVRASGIFKSHEKVKFAYSINIRRVVQPPLSAGYWGNACVPMYVQLSAKDLIEGPIWETAERIKKSKSCVSDEYVRSFIDFQEVHYGDGITAGKGVSGFTDWRHLGHSTVDFGWGGPVSVLPLGMNLLGSVEPCFFLPYSTASQEKKEGFKVLVTLPEAALPAFKEDMQVFAKIQITYYSSLINGSNVCSYRTSVFNNIMEALKSRYNNTVGVWEPESPEIADLLDKVSRRSKRDGLFDVVIMASVTQEPNYERIQDEIAESLGFKFDHVKHPSKRFIRRLHVAEACCLKSKENDVAKRAERLRERILMKQRVLVILRDLHMGLDLETIGIPSGADHTGCKLLLTSARHEVLSEQMHAQIILEVK